VERDDYEVTLAPIAIEHLKSLDGSVRDRVFRKIDHLQINPLAGKPLTGPLQGSNSIRAAGRYRIVYRIDEVRRMVEVWAIGIRHDGDAHDIYKVATAIVAAGDDVA
jgi:mRNA-degrading endonuclease RelE of RelBE toxin-antitoxin system